MQTSDVTPDRLRRLAEVRPPHGKVLSLYVDLDPSQFATAEARTTQINSLLDQADRWTREEGAELPHDDRVALRNDVQRAREYLEGNLDADGAHGYAIFCSSPAHLFEALRLPRAVEHRLIIADAPYLEPLTEVGTRVARWAVLLVDRRHTRILRGTAEAMEEVERVRDHVPGQHDQGGLSQPRYGRHIDEQAARHVRNASDELLRELQREPFDRLVVAASEELWTEVEHDLHADLRRRLAGRIHVDVEHSHPDDVHRAAREVIEEDERRHEREALDRLAAGLGTGGHATAGLGDVLTALTERRVEILLIAPGFRAPGTRCPRCGFLGPEGPTECPVDGTALLRCGNIVDAAARAAVAQSAEVLVVHHHPDPGPPGSIGAVLRF